MNVELETNHDKYNAAIERVIEGEVEFEYEVRAQAARLIIDVINGELSVADLRGGVLFANALDRESSTCSNGSFSTQECLRRRLQHHSGRLALGHVRSHSRLDRARAFYTRAMNKTKTDVAREVALQTANRTVENLVQYL